MLTTAIPNVEILWWGVWGPTISVGGWTLNRHVPSRALPIHLFRHFCYRMHCLATMHIVTDIHSFISGMHHYECVAPNVDIILQSEWFWATSIALFRERFSDSRSCWVVFIHVVRGRPSRLLQFSKGEAVKICLASDLSGIHAVWPNRERCHAWTV